MKSVARFLVTLGVLCGSAFLVYKVDAATTLSGAVMLPSPTLVMPGPILLSQQLRIGEAVAITVDPRNGSFQRPIGSMIYARTGGAAYVKTDTPAAAWEAIGQGSISGSANRAGFLTGRAAFLAGIPVGTLTCFREDYAYSSAATIYTNTVVGTGTLSNTSAVGGKWQLNTGTTAASSSTSVGPNGLLGQPSTTRGYFAARWDVTSFTPDAQTVQFVGVQDFASGAIGIALCGAASTTNYVFTRDGAICAGTQTSTGIAATPGTAHLWELAFDGASHVSVYVDTALVFTQTISSPPGISRPMVTVQNGTTAAGRGLEIDYTQTCWPET